MHTRLGFRSLLVLVLALLGAGVCSAQRPAAPPSTAPTTPAVAPEVLTALEQMGAFLRSLKTFTLHADITTDEVLADTGQKIQFGSTVDYHVRAPDRLQADVTSDRKHRQFFYNGTTLTLYGQRVKFYASVPAPPTIRETIEMAAQKYGLEVPLADLFFWGTDKTHPEDITAAIDVGPGSVNGVLCDHYAFRQQDVDWQLWIERGTTRLPRKLVITTTEEDEQPQYVAVLTWTLEPSLDDALFTFVPPAEAQKIVLREVTTQPPDKPAGKSTGKSADKTSGKL